MKTITKEQAERWVEMIDKRINADEFFGTTRTSYAGGAPCCALGHIAVLEGIEPISTDDVMRRLLDIEYLEDASDTASFDLLTELYVANDAGQGNPLAVRRVLERAFKLPPRKS